MRRAAVLALLAAAALMVAAAAPLVGLEKVSPAALWSADDAVDAEILWKIRLPRVAAAFLAGAALAVSGAAFQGVFRNPLAEPFTLGVSSGAALGASLAIHLKLGAALTVRIGPVPLSVAPTAWFALAGATAAIGLVYGLTRLRRGFSSATLLLAGVAVSFFFSSLVLFLQYISDPTQTFLMLRWVMGGLERIVGFDDVLGLLPFAAGGCLIVLYLAHELDLLSTGDDLAAARGVEVHRVKMALFFAASLSVAGVVAACGPIGFVGLIAPHICRLLVGPGHRGLVPASLLFGGAFLVLCDTLARTLMAPTELPVGILTALLGGPFFLWLLLGRTGRSEG